MGNLANFLEFAKVGELRHEEEYCLSRGILSFVGKGWLPSTLLAFILQTKQINRSPFACHVNTQTGSYLKPMFPYISTWHSQKTSSSFLIFKGYSQIPNNRGSANYDFGKFYQSILIYYDSSTNLWLFGKEASAISGKI